MKQSQWKINNTLDETNLLDYSTICCICFSQDPIDSETGESFHSPLISACLCIGIKSKQHRYCIEDWIEKSGATTCPFCGVKYEFKRKQRGYFDYIRSLIRINYRNDHRDDHHDDNHNDHDSLINLFTLVFLIYLFLIGLAVCLHYISITGNNNNIVISKPGLGQLMIFCFVGISTILLFLSIISMSMETVFLHYVKFRLWSSNHFKITVINM